MNIKNYILIASLACACSSCELLQPNEIINPNVDEDTFLKTPNAMSTWVNGANRSFATIIGSYVELTEILSDNYFNNYSQSSKVFDFPTILYTDIDVTNLQRHVGTLRETAIQGLEVVAKPMQLLQMNNAIISIISRDILISWQENISGRSLLKTGER